MNRLNTAVTITMMSVSNDITGIYHPVTILQQRPILAENSCKNTAEHWRDMQRRNRSTTELLL